MWGMTVVVTIINTVTVLLSTGVISVCVIVICYDCHSYHCTHWTHVQ
jgi:hypothetical protein